MRRCPIRKVTLGADVADTAPHETDADDITQRLTLAGDQVQLSMFSFNCIHSKLVAAVEGDVPAEGRGGTVAVGRTGQWTVRPDMPLGIMAAANGITNLSLCDIV
jgi:hypothetical protein